MSASGRSWARSRPAPSRSPTAPARRPGGGAPAAPDADPAGRRGREPAGGRDVAPDVKDPAKKPRGWRKNRLRGGQDVATGMAVAPPRGAAQPAAPSFFAPVEPPAEPPSDPCPSNWPARCRLRPRTIRHPPLSAPMTWKPPIDPATGQPAWDQSARAGRRSAEEAEELAEGERRRRRRRRCHRCCGPWPTRRGPDAGLRRGRPGRHRAQPSGEPAAGSSRRATGHC